MVTVWEFSRKSTFLPCHLPSPPYHKYTLSNNNVGRRGESFAQQNLSFCTFLLMSGNYTLAEPAVLKCLSLYTSWKIQPCHHYTLQAAVFLRGQLYLATKKLPLISVRTYVELAASWLSVNHNLMWWLATCIAIFRRYQLEEQAMKRFDKVLYAMLKRDRALIFVFLYRHSMSFSKAIDYTCTLCDSTTYYAPQSAKSLHLRIALLYFDQRVYT